MKTFISSDEGPIIGSRVILDTDFSNSFVQWWMDVTNHSPRCALKAKCSISSGIDVQHYYLTYPCAGENMYVEIGLIQEPVAEFQLVFSECGELLILKHFTDAEDSLRSVNRVGTRIPTHDKRGCIITRLEKCIRTFKSVVQLRTDREVYDAMTNNIPILGRTIFSLPRGSENVTVVAEYPVTVMNAHHDSYQWQVDTGTILLPDPQTDENLGITSMREALIVFNRFDLAEFTLRTTLKTRNGGHAMHFGCPIRIQCRNELFAAVAI